MEKTRASWVAACQRVGVVMSNCCSMMVHDRGPVRRRETRWV